ncbi:maltose acetyltransferase domain-containing protein [Pseudoroseomonas wenyumeiae]
MPTEKEKMLAGELYDAGDAELQADAAAARAWMVRYNASSACRWRSGASCWPKAWAPSAKAPRCGRPSMWTTATTSAWEMASS